MPLPRGRIAQLANQSTGQSWLLLHCRDELSACHIGLEDQGAGKGSVLVFTQSGVVPLGYTTAFGAVPRDSYMWTLVWPIGSQCLLGDAVQVVRGGAVGAAQRGDALPGRGLECHHLGRGQQQPAAARAGQLPRRLSPAHAPVLVGLCSGRPRRAEANGGNGRAGAGAASRATGPPSGTS